MNNEIPCMIVSFLLGLLFGAILFTTISIGRVVELRQEAVKHNAAYWEVGNTGNTTFKWNDEKGSK